MDGSVTGGDHRFTARRFPASCSARVGLPRSTFCSSSSAPTRRVVASRLGRMPTMPACRPAPPSRARGNRCAEHGARCFSRHSRHWSARRPTGPLDAARQSRSSPAEYSHPRALPPAPAGSFYVGHRGLRRLSVASQTYPKIADGHPSATRPRGKQLRHVGRITADETGSHPINRSRLRNHTVSNESKVMRPKCLSSRLDWVRTPDRGVAGQHSRSRRSLGVLEIGSSSNVHASDMALPRYRQIAQSIGLNPMLGMRIASP